MDLTSLVIAAQQGDLEAFGRIVERFQRMAQLVDFTLTADAHLAEDAAQEAFIEAYLCLSKLREPAAFPGWFRRIVIKRADRLTRGRHRSTLPIEMAGDLAHSAADPHNVAETREMQQVVHSAIARLPESERLITTLFYLMHCSQQEIAAITELPVGTIKKRLYDARQRLRRHMDSLVPGRSLEQPAPGDRFARIIQFFIAVRTADLARVRAYLDSDHSLINERERWDETEARRFGITNVGSFTALHRAIFNGDQAMIDLLLEYNADINIQTRLGETPLHTAVLCNRLAAVTCLLAANANPNIGTEQGMTPVHWAVLRNRQPIIELLLSYGADPTLSDKHGRSPLDWARLKQYDNLVDLLIRQPITI